MTQQRLTNLLCLLSAITLLLTAYSFKTHNILYTQVDRLKQYSDFRWKTPLPSHCIEENICKNPEEKTDIYYYQRTNFDELAEKPVNLYTNINNSFRVVPRKVHFCLFFNQNFVFRFHSMIAIMAASRFVRPDRIYIWHDNLPTGKYWEETIRRVPNLYLVHRDRPTSIRGNKLKILEHVADVVRLEALMEFGGMYFDLDSVVVNPIDPLLKYDVTLGQETREALANGILFSKAWSDFFKIWHKQYETFDDSRWGDHSVIRPFQLSRMFPKLLRIEDNSICRPNWNEQGFIFGSKLWNWQENNYVVHLYMRFLRPRIEPDPEYIKTWNTTAGSVMRHIYYSNATLWRK